MAEAGYGCVFGDCAKQFRYMITDVSNGVTITLCDEHYPPGLIPLLASELGVDPGEFYAMVERYVKRQSAKADKALADVQAAAAAEDSQHPADPPELDLGDAVDDQGGMSEVYGNSMPAGGDAA